MSWQVVALILGIVWAIVMIIFIAAMISMFNKGEE